MTDLESGGKKIYFIAPSTRLKENDNPALQRVWDLMSRSLGAGKTTLSPFLFTKDSKISHVTASTEERSREFKEVLREYDVIVSVAGGTGAEDVVPTLDGTDFRTIRKRKPLFIGFSDFTFLLNELYSRCHVPGILFPSLRLEEENMAKLMSLIRGEEVAYRGSFWLSDIPEAPLTGIPIGGNLTTFVNFLNREKPPRLRWRDHVLFIEDIQVDLEDLHRLLAALRRHRVFRNIRSLVLGSLREDPETPEGKDFQDKARAFLMAYLSGVLRKRRDENRPLPIMVLEHFGHHLTKDLPAVPIGGQVSLGVNLDVTFRLG